MKNVEVDFFVIGAARAGTTTLYSYLSQHPSIFLPNVKECNYFSDVDSIDTEVYKEPSHGKKYHMKIINSEKRYNKLYLDAAGDQLKGDVSPSYLWDLKSAKKIYNHNKNTKIILSLRNPIERAYSHYLMHYNTGYEKEKTFEMAIQADKRHIWGGGNMYLEMSLYFNQIQAYFNTFSSENIKILIYEDWIKHKEMYLNEVYTFLGIKPFSDYNLKDAFNKTQAVKNKKALDLLRQEKLKTSLRKILPEELTERIKQRFFYKEADKPVLSEKTIEKLTEYFKEDIEKTEVLISQPLTNKWVS
ncbi:MAG: hypothetical protein CMC13_01505 [Flavobacteriaceae bacterium]|nr:hypothetical protein [Flavobacteriaceae bacterium]|tara:strand:- start:9962 stop:10867 length:906 start_codon:yes stop_codon:yes gene_type:complete